MALPPQGASGRALSAASVPGPGATEARAPGLGVEMVRKLAATLVLAYLPSRFANVWAGRKGPEGGEWRQTLKRRCPSVLASPGSYDADLVSLCRLVARLR